MLSWAEGTDTSSIPARLFGTEQKKLLATYAMFLESLFQDLPFHTADLLLDCDRDAGETQQTG
jgi:hypothetical protein